MFGQSSSSSSSSQEPSDAEQLSVSLLTNSFVEAYDSKKEAFRRLSPFLGMSAKTLSRRYADGNLTGKISSTGDTISDLISTNRHVFLQSAVRSLSISDEIQTLLDARQNDLSRAQADLRSARRTIDVLNLDIFQFRSEMAKRNQHERALGRQTERQGSAETGSQVAGLEQQLFAAEKKLLDLTEKKRETWKGFGKGLDVEIDRLRGEVDRLGTGLRQKERALQAALDRAEELEWGDQLQSGMVKRFRRERDEARRERDEAQDELEQAEEQVKMLRDRLDCFDCSETEF